MTGYKIFYDQGEMKKLSEINMHQNSLGTYRRKRGQRQLHSKGTSSVQGLQGEAFKGTKA